MEEIYNNLIKKIIYFYESLLEIDFTQFVDMRNESNTTDTYKWEINESNT